MPGLDIPAEVNGEEIAMAFGDRRYRLRGLAKNMSHELLKSICWHARAYAFHVDTLDLYAARQRAMFIKQAADEMGGERRR
jgi:DNA primase